MRDYKLLRTSRVHGHADILDDTVFSKYLAYVVFFDVLGQGLDYNLEGALAIGRQG